MSILQHATVLVIEDDEAVRRTLVDILELNGIRTVAAANGIEGFAAARQNHPSLIITDLAMPGMTGYELLAEFRRDEALRSIPVIVISAAVERAATRRGMNLGAADFITKPFTEEEVIQSITTRLEKKDLIDELDAFSHTVAHDLRNPLATLCGRIELAEMMLGRCDEATMRQHLAEAAKSAHRLSRIIDELLLLAGARRQTVVPEPLDMAAIVVEATDRLESILKEKSTMVRQPAGWPAAVGYAPWVVEIWVNFISNAAKYGGANPQITLGGETSADGRSSRFWVQDAGPGLDEAGRQKMFVPFTRISTVRAMGHGLGLSIVRRIVEKLGGQVGVESSPGAGARFWFELPTTAPAPKPAAALPPVLFTP